jgi:glycosyltransferase involved in cell wall biosynthesis
MKSVRIAKKALVIAERPSFPANDGARLRIASILRALEPITIDFVHLYDPEQEFVPVERELRHCHTLAAIPHDSRLTDWSRACSVFSLSPNGAFRNRSKAMREFLCNLASNVYDFVLVCGVNMVQYTPHIRVRPLFVDMCDSEPRHMEVREAFVHDPLRKAYFRWQRCKVLRHIRSTGAHCESWLVISEIERRSLNSYFPDMPAYLIPNSVTGAPSGSSRSTREPLIVLSGNFGFYPNVDAALFFGTNVMPLISKRVPGCALRILGNNPPPEIRALRSDVVEVTGFVRDFGELLSEAAVYVCSLRLGTGIKNNVLQAMAAGLPVISTPVGIEGIGAVKGTHYLESTTAVEFADSVLRILSNPELRQSIGTAARTFVLNHFSPAAVSTALEAAIKFRCSGQSIVC